MALIGWYVAFVTPIAFGCVERHLEAHLFGAVCSLLAGDHIDEFDIIRLIQNYHNQSARREHKDLVARSGGHQTHEHTIIVQAKWDLSAKKDLREFRTEFLKPELPAIHHDGLPDKDSCLWIVTEMNQPVVFDEFLHC